MIINERNNRAERVVEAGKRMLTAARTAPKAKGVDILECCLVTGDDLRKVSDAMFELHAQTGRPVFLRDANNLLKADALLIVATHLQPMGLNCGHCGFPTCGEKPTQVPCAFNLVDVGIAIGSAVATAADCRVDCRVMYSVGMAAKRLNLLTHTSAGGTAHDCIAYFGIPLSSSSKSPFFDR